MTTGEAVRQALLGDPTVAGLVAARIYPLLMPQGAVVDGSGPVLVYTASDVPQNTVGATSISRSLVQIDCYSLTYVESHLVSDAVVAALSALATPTLSAWLQVTRDLYDNESQLFRVSADFSVWR